MALELGLTYHEKYIQEYLQFARRKRSQCLRSIQSAFDSLTEAQLKEDNTFTNSEVQDMITGIWTAIQADLEAELINSSHVSALLLQQLFQQAEKVYVKMQPQIAELDSLELLKGMAAYEQQLTTATSSLSLRSSTHSRKLLEPLNFTGGENLLQKEIERLTSENDKLKDRIKMLERKASSFLEEKDKLKSELSTTSAHVKDDEEQGNISALKKQLASLQLECTRAKENSKNIEDKHSQTTEELRRVEKELERTKEELERKVSDTAQFRTMKTMLKSKSDQIKELRTKLQQYGDNI